MARTPQEGLASSAPPLSAINPDPQALVKDARETAESLRGGSCGHASNVIDSLLARLEEQEGLLDLASEMGHSLEARLEATERERDMYRDAAEEFERLASVNASDAEAAEQRVKALEEALRPFTESLEQTALAAATTTSLPPCAAS